MRVWKCIATAGGIGRIPVGSGTFGSAAGLILFLFIAGNPLAQGICAVAVATVGVVAAGRVSAAMDDEDPSCVVVDEVAGMLVALVFLPCRWQVLTGAFFLFRFLDVFKPFGIRRVEQLPGGWGIMADDLLAGLLTNLFLRLFLSF
ncbi:MAG: phosphatidylglycerophosphatase A [Candidatus Omnitrophica bacterium]|nr:phosphatidylglycerophosphatase A [Candidatus Omnitrophota bacterium]